MTEPVRLLPPNATAIERAFERVLGQIETLPTPIREVWNADTCPMPLLPWLAWALGIRSWSSDWSEQVRRSVVRNALAIARRKGTVESVRSTVSAFGGTMAVIEWHQQTPKGQPHTFTVVLTLNGEDGAPSSAKFVDEVIGEIYRTKPVRSHFTFTQGLSSSGGLGVFGGAQAALYRRLEFEQQAA